MKNQFPTLITPNALAGLALASKLADELRAEADKAGARVERPGGMNYQQLPTVPLEIISGILFYAIAAANQGWPGGSGIDAALRAELTPA
ncbi:MAG TPA: hypothetical protein VIT91_14860 [Chthoniobacterales bacterium]